jgi:hypothetical protein
MLGVGGAVPSESTFRRTLQCLGADAFDGLAGAWAQQQTARGPRGRRVIAVDGKTLRGSASGGKPVITCWLPWIMFTAPSWARWR